MPYIIMAINPKGASEQDAQGRSFYVPTSTRRATVSHAEVLDWIASPDSPGITYETLIKLHELIPEEGGTLGPLVDGITVVVQKVSWDQLSAEVPIGESAGGYDALIDAFNARELEAVER